MHMLDWLQWEWAAKAHHAVAQLQAWQGGHTKACRLLDSCLKLNDGQDLAQPQLHCGEGPSGAAAAGSVDSQGAAPRDTPESSAGTCIVGPDVPGTTAVDLDMHRPCSIPTEPPSCPAWLLAELDQPLTEDGSADSGDRITQMTRQMADDVFLMAQSLSSRGRGLTKEELIASARKVAMSGQSFARLLHVVAESCTDARCLQELLCALEQVQTMSNQLHIISSVKASMARSKSSEELLVGNAQQVLHAVGKTMRAAEAASLRGLRHRYPDPEELDVAALCMRWRRKLLQRRLRETPNLDGGELGLRKTSADDAPSAQAPGAPVPEVVLKPTGFL
ncbi:PREDICTED: vinculin-like [Hipposideros armiger]|uniref:Vinculin-like n=1 Tax=Hipposideros armiger TaxID=186990 RepID=A0A8B7SYC3_HIPAR|nr:PREDICTED: vinculin-like [Hipposideros armiger]